MTDEQTASSAPLESWDVPASVRWTSAYLKRLIIERHRIRAKLENPGGSVIMGATSKLETDMTQDYSSVIGNTFHLDLIDAEDVLLHMDAIERKQLLEWCDGLPSRTAAEYAGTKPTTVRKRGLKIVKQVVDRLNGEPTTVTVKRVA